MHALAQLLDRSPIRQAGEALVPIRSWSVNDLPNAIAGSETGDEAHPFRKTRAGKERAKGDVDNDRAPPDASPALDLSFRPSLNIGWRGHRPGDLRPRGALLPSKGS